MYNVIKYKDTKWDSRVGGNNIFKVGDKVWSTNLGWGEVIRISEKNNYYPLYVNFKNEKDIEYTLYYTACGRLHEKHIMPSLFFQEIPIEILKEYQKRPRWRAEEGTSYFYINTYGVVYETTDERYSQNDEMFKAGNYFQNEEEAKESKFYKVFHEEEF